MATTSQRPRAKTWSLFGDVGRKVTEYEAVTGGFHYHYRRDPAPFELDPNHDVNRWYIEHRENSPFNVADWESFRDPHKLTYRTYVALQTQRESYLENVVDDYEAHDHDAGLSPDWVATMERVYLPARFAFHGLQMAALYVGQMAPSSYITNAAHFQAGDEMRRIQWFAYRAKSLSLSHGDIFADSEATRARWEDDLAWQPMREAIEKLLITYDWGEAFVALNLSIKPAVDDLLNVRLGALADANGDGLTARMASEFQRDAQRSRDWSAALVQYALAADPSLRDLLNGWVDKWSGPADAAAAGLAPLLETSGETGIVDAVAADRQHLIEVCGLS